MPKKIDLKYATNGKNFFSDVRTMKEAIKKHKEENLISEFTEKDEKEIGRADSYAVFPELKEQYDKGVQVTINAFRQSLLQRGISDVGFQNKILDLILQHRSGIHFGFGKILGEMFLKNDILLCVDNDTFKVALDVKNDSSVDMMFTIKFRDATGTLKQDAFDVMVKVNINPNMVSINEFSLTKIGDTPETNKGYALLEANQQNILMKLITYIKHVLGFNSELRLEEKQDNDQSWSPKI